MGFDEYQTKIKKYDVSDDSKTIGENDGNIIKSQGLIEKLLGLTGEAGEVADKFKKIYRDKNGKLSEEDREEITKELGDVLWYVATIARYLDVPFSEVAEKNVEKAESRRKRGKIHGAGDNR